MARLIEQGLTVVATKIAGVAGHVFRGPARVIRSWMLPDKLSHDLRSLLVHPSGPATVAWRGYKNHTSNLAEAAERTYNQRRHSRSSASNQHASAGARAVVQCAAYQNPTYSGGCGVLSDLASSDLHNWRLSETARDEAILFCLDAHIRSRLLRPVLVWWKLEKYIASRECNRACPFAARHGPSSAVYPRSEDPSRQFVDCCKCYNHNQASRVSNGLINREA